MHGIGAHEGLEISAQSHAYELLKSWGLPTSERVKVVKSVQEVKDSFYDYIRAMCEATKSSSCKA